MLDGGDDIAHDLRSPLTAVRTGLDRARVITNGSSTFLLHGGV